MERDLPYNPYLPQYGSPPGNPYGTYQTPQYNQHYQQPVHGFVYVNGIEGARAYQMPPNSEMPLFDSNTDGVMYVKKTDGAGYPTITVVDCKERDGSGEGGFATKDEVERMYSDLAAQLERLKEAMHAAVPTTATSELDAIVPAGSERRPPRHGRQAEQD